MADAKFEQDGINLRTLRRYSSILTANTISTVVSGITSGANISISGSSSAITISLSPNVVTNSINANTILSAGTDLYSIFLTTADGNDITRLQSGLNTYTGGTANNPTINISAATLNYLSATTISAGTYYGDGSNLSGISTDNFYTTGATLSGNTILFSRNDLEDAYSVNLSGITSTGNFLAISGGTVTGNTNFTQNLSASTFYSGSTSLQTILNQISSGSTGSGGFSGWTGSSGINSIIANNGTGNLAYGSYSVVAGRGNQIANNYGFIGGGKSNYILNPYAFIGGGSSNYVYGNNSIIVGGKQNKAGSTYSFIGGGYKNVSNGNGSLVVGGQSNSATTLYSSVLGGKNNLASGYYSFIGSGFENVILPSLYTSIVGGAHQLSTGSYSFIGGGFRNSGLTNYSTIVGGAYNLSNGNRSFIGAGDLNKTYGTHSVIGGGTRNISSGNHSSILGGSGNTISGTYSAIVGGFQNKTTNSYSFIGGGKANSATTNYSSIVGGYKNLAYGDNSFIGGGYNNKITGINSIVGGGKANSATTNLSVVVGGGYNLVSSPYSSILGGKNNIVSAAYSSVLAGFGITASTSNTAYVPKLNINTLHTGTSINNLGIDSNGFVVSATSQTYASQTYMLFSDNSDLVGYKQAVSLPLYVTGVTSTIISAVTTSPTLIAKFSTNSGYPGVTSIPAGQIVGHFETEKAAGSNNYYSYFEIYKIDTGGTETLLTTSDTSTQSASNAKIQNTVSAFLNAAVTLNINDRIIFKLYSVLLSASANITLYYDDNTNARFELPSQVINVNNLVPYNGAITNLNLGNNNLSANTISATTLNANLISNTRIRKRFLSVSSSTTPTINTNNSDIFSITGLSTNITSFTANLTGTPIHGDLFSLEIRDNGVARTLAFGASFSNSGTLSLPTTTVISTLLRCLFQYNSITSKWEIVAVV